MTSVAKEKSEICHISFTFPITVANENFNLAGALGWAYLSSQNPQKAKFPERAF
jgi:hypothetical protein